MRSLARSVSLVFAAGAMGALANSAALWAMGTFGVSGFLGVAIAPTLSPGWLYPRIVWGGLWGGLFLLPASQTPRQAVLLSLAPSAFQLFFVFPLLAGKGIAGFELGLLTPVVVGIANAVWGLATLLWLRWTGR